MSARAIVIGAGVNELVCAHALARAGHPVLVLEGRAPSDGEPGDCGWIPPRVVRSLDLEARGLKVHRPDPWASAPLPGGGRLDLWQDVSRSVETIGKLCPRDAARWPRFCERMALLARLLETIYCEPPPDFLGAGVADLARLVPLALSVRRLGREGMEDLLRVLPMPAADFLDEHFENDTLKGLLGAIGVTHFCQGPRSGGTAFRLLHHHVGNPPGVFRAPSSNLRDVLTRLPGIELRRGAAVARIAVRDGRVTGVILAGGEEMEAALVVSGDPRETLLGLVDTGWLDPELVRAVRNVRRRGVVARVAVTVEAAPDFSTLVVAPALDYLERAYDHAKHGRVSEAPLLEAHSNGKTAEGRHRLDVHVQYAPYVLAEGQWDGARRTLLGERVARMLSEHVPTLGAAAVERVLAPPDLEDTYGWPEGQMEQAEPGLDQLFSMRPVPELARYRTPIAGLYLCGAGMHPGGLGGAPGYNAARQIVRDG